MLVYPSIDPIALSIGPFAIRWYGLAYVAGILLGWRWGVFLIKRYKIALGEKIFSDYIPWAALGIVGGGRLGHVIFYQPAYYLNHPLEIFYIWHPGMSFHGGLLGVLVATFFYTKNHKLSLKPFLDLLAVCAPLGLFFGRLANFINGELIGRPSSVPWAMIFPETDGLPRHPSQLYEAALEGILLFIALNMLYMKSNWRQKYEGASAGLFALSYGLARIGVECFREPDAHLGYIATHFTYGQLYSLPLVFLGLTILWQVPWTQNSPKPSL